MSPNARKHPAPSGTARIGGLAAAVAAAATVAASSAHAAPGCSARSPAAATPVVELYTSEGCSSCPPADRWLSRLKAGPAVVALAFHVDYWDRLGWKDRFASPAYTQRQAQQQASSGARFSYTPQVLIDGADRPDWPGAAASVAQPRRGVAPVTLQLVRDGDRYTATVSSTATATTLASATTAAVDPASVQGITAPLRRLAAYWAVTEQAHSSAVKAGENHGATLAHDFVVREYRPVAPWAARPDGAAATLHFEPAAPADPAHAREVNLVVVNADTGRPVQALKLGC